MQEILKPMDIEKRSFEIISQEIGSVDLNEKELLVLKRVIHTTADFDYKENLVFRNNPVEKGIEALKKGCVIVTDTNMALAGINKPSLKKGGNSAVCYIGDEDVAYAASEKGVTRAQAAVEKAAKLNEPVIFAIGNAPTALIKIDELIVNVVESKELILKHNIPSITSVGRKGGSNVAAAVINAMLYQAFPR